MAMRKLHTVRALFCTAVALSASVVGLPASPAQAATPPMNLQMPVQCGTTWTGNPTASSAHKGYEIDFNWGSGSDDLGKPVLASAAGKVVTSSYQTTNGFGNLVVVDHGGGWKTYYAHLNTRAVARDAIVSQGQTLGTLGKTSATNPGISPHLHWEVRYGSSYPANIQPAVFDGVAYRYPTQTLRSRNCGTDPQKVCGSGYAIKSRGYIKNSTGTHYGTAYLLRNSATSQNCVVTAKHRGAGTLGSMRASVEVPGKPAVVDSGSYTRYAGPVRVTGTGCVRYSGAIGTLSVARSLGC